MVVEIAGLAKLHHATQSVTHVKTPLYVYIHIQYVCVLKSEGRHMTPNFAQACTQLSILYGILAHA